MARTPKKLGLLALLVAAAGAVFAKRKNATSSAGGFSTPSPTPAPSQAPVTEPVGAHAAEPVVPAQPTADQAGATPGEALSDGTDEPVEPTTPDAPAEETTDVIDPLTDER